MPTRSRPPKPPRATNWRKRLASGKASKRVTLERDFAGIRAGSTLFIATPEIVSQYVASIPYGETRTVVRLRNELARRHRADATCPVTTAIFLRVVCEAAWDELQAGASVENVVPFWRVVEPDSPIARRLRCDSAWLRERRLIEAGE
jgi:hypothetical protein